MKIRHATALLPLILLVGCALNGKNQIRKLDLKGLCTKEYPTFNDYRTAVSDRKVQGAFRSGWQPDYPSAENYLVANYASAAADGNGSNDGDYKNSEFDDLCSKAAAAQTTDEANKLYQQAQEILLNDLPAIPLYYSNANGVAASGVKNFVMNWQNVPVYNEISKS